MANTFTKIATVTVGSGGSATMDFTSIPATYTDLVLKMSLRTNRAGANQQTVRITLNGSATSYSGKLVEGDGATAGSFAGNTTFLDTGYASAATGTASTFSNGEIYFPNYAGSNNKSLSTDTVSENNTTTAYATLFAGLWSNTGAITSIKIDKSTADNFVQYSTATLYGVRNN